MTPGRDVHLKRIAGEERNVRRKGLVRRDDPLFELQLLHKDVAHQTARGVLEMAGALIKLFLNDRGNKRIRVDLPVRVIGESHRLPRPCSQK